MPAKHGFELRDSDIAILHSVYQLRIATIDHVAALTGRSVRALWGRLLKLKQRRYLAAATRFMQKHVYAVGPAGLPVLVEHGYAPREVERQRVRHNELTDIGIRHALFIADIHARLLRLTRGTAITLAHWQEGPTLWDKVPSATGGAAAPVRPDAYFVLQDASRPEGRNKIHTFLEADRSTMAHSRMASKIAAYLAYYEQRGYTRKYPTMQTFLVATVTQTRARAEALQVDLHPLVPRAAWRDAYRFIPFEELTLDSFLPKAPASA